MPLQPPALLVRLALLWVPLATLGWLLGGWHLAYKGLGALSPSGLPVAALTALAAATVMAGLLAFCGGMIIRPLRGHGMRGAEVFALGFLLAQAALGAVLGWGGFLVVGPVVGLPLLAACSFWLWRRERNWLQERYLGYRSRAAQSPGGLVSLRRTFHAVTWFFFLLVVLAALAPAVESDGLRYHLVAPREWLRAGQFVNLPYNANSNLPALSGLLVASLTGVVELGRVTQLFQAFNLGALAIISGGLARQVFLRLPPSADRPARDDAERLLGSAMPLLIVGIPVVAILGGWPFTDLGSAVFLIAALRVSAPGGWNGAASPRGRWFAAGLLLGGAIAVKLSSLPLAVGVGVYAMIRLFRQAGAAGNLAAYVLGGGLVLGPWLVKSLIHHGNPVYPVAWGLLGGTEWSAFNQQLYEYLASRRGMGTGVGALLLLPWNLLRNWPAFEEHNPGPVVMAFLPVLAAGLLLLLAKGYRWNPRRIARSFPVALTAVLLWGVLTWFFTYQSVRFLIPHLVLLAILGASFLVWLVAARPRLLLELGAWLLVLGIAGASWAPAFRIIDQPVVQAAIGLEDTEDFITRRFNAYPAVRWLNENTEPGEPVFYVGEFRAAHAETYRPLASDWFDTPLVLVELRRTGSAPALLDDLSRRHVRHVLYNEAELSLFMDVFRARFNEREWQQFTELREVLLDNIVYDSMAGVYVCSVP